MSRFEHYGVVVTPEDFKGADWIGLCRRHGLRTLGIHSGGGKIADVLKMLGRYGGAAFRAEVAAAGLECEYECHAAASLLQPALFAEHPDYFAFDLRRRARRNDSNWCVTNPEAQAKLNGLVKPADEEGIIRYWAEAAKRLEALL